MIDVVPKAEMRAYTSFRIGGKCIALVNISSVEEVIKVTDDCAFVLGGHGEDKTDAINSVYLSGINADALQQYLSTKKIYIGSGASACSDKNDYRVLCDGYGYSKETAEETIRISFSQYTKKSDIDALVSGISDFYKNFCKTY